MTRPELSVLGEDRLAAIVESVEPGAQLLAISQPAGGISSVTTMLDVVRPDGVALRLVVRRRLHGPDSYSMGIDDEVRLLQAVARRGLPVPRVRLVDVAGAYAPEPLCVLEHLGGDPRFSSGNDPVVFGEALAEQLADIHAVDGDDPDLAFLRPVTARFGPWLDRHPDTLDSSMGEAGIVAALRAHWPPPLGRRALLHGDFWPGNLLWSDDRITGVIDWSDAVLGDPLADVATLRLDLRFLGSRAAAAALTKRYATLTGADLSGLPLWDLCAALRPCGYVSVWAADLNAVGSPVNSSSMRSEHAAFVAEALAELH